VITGRYLARLHMPDVCRFGYQAAGTGVEPGGGAWTWNTTDYRCQVMLGQFAESGEGGQVTIGDGQIRVEFAAVVNETNDRAIQADDAVKVTTRHGATVSEFYKILGEPLRAPCGFVLNVRRFTPDASV